MTRPFFTFISVISLFLCVATAALWLLSGLAPHLLEAHLVGNHGWSLTIYARHDGLGWRSFNSRGASGWDFSYPSICLLTLLLPATWIWCRVRAGKRTTESNIGAAQGSEEQVLRERIRFLLPPLVAVYVMVGFAVTALDSRQWSIIVMAASLEAALIVNIAARHRLNARLDRLLASRRHPTCGRCGYNLTGNVSGVCPECGTPGPPKAIV